MTEKEEKRNAIDEKVVAGDDGLRKLADLTERVVKVKRAEVLKSKKPPRRT